MYQLQRFEDNYLIYIQNITIKSHDGSDRLQYCAWMENSNSSLVYVFGNNIYVR